MIALRNGTGRSWAVFCSTAANSKSESSEVPSINCSRLSSLSDTSGKWRPIMRAASAWEIRLPRPCIFSRGLSTSQTSTAATAARPTQKIRPLPRGESQPKCSSSTAARKSVSTMPTVHNRPLIRRFL